ncbi:MAG: glycogen-binding domain-containing protein [Verrucomicrobia bacterium]|nr:glycogen-binding domain-containing protein [Verrucomicrobiota bacterium]
MNGGDYQDRQLDERLASARMQAPDGFASRVVARIREEESSAASVWSLLWPAGQWFVPAAAGALATLLLVIGITFFGRHGGENVKVTFELHAPDAHQVELAGSFNDWARGRIVLDGPDATGNWTATVSLPAGRHEYLFMVDGREWVTDPKATVFRPDGFGNRNAVLDI